MFKYENETGKRHTYTFSLKILFSLGMKKYKFAWHMDQEDANSNLTVSSVHTSDLSVSEDFTSESELEYSDLTDHENDEDEMLFSPVKSEEKKPSPDKVGENKQESDAAVEKTDEEEEKANTGVNQAMVENTGSDHPLYLLILKNFLKIQGKNFFYLQMRTLVTVLILYMYL